MKAMTKAEGNLLKLIDDFIAEYYVISLVCIILLGIALTLMWFPFGIVIFFVLDIAWMIMARRNKDRLQRPQINKGMVITATGLFVMLIVLITSLSVYINEVTPVAKQCNFLFQGWLKVNGSPEIFENLSYDDIVYNKSLQEKYGWGV